MTPKEKKVYLNQAKNNGKIFNFFPYYRGWGPFIAGYWITSWFAYHPFVALPAYFGWGWHAFLGHYAGVCYCNVGAVFASPSVAVFDDAYNSDDDSNLADKLADLE